MTILCKRLRGKLMVFGITDNSHSCLPWAIHFMPDAEMESVGVLVNYKSE